jgi:uncharacterized protein (TIGR00369 family)
VTNDVLTEMIHTTMPLCATLGVTASKFDAAGAVLHLPWTAELCTSGGLLHGGALMALADAAGAACAFANLPEGAVGTSTIESKTNFLGGVTAGQVTASATPLHIGSTTIVIEVELTNEDRLVAKVTQTQIILRPR